MWDVEGILKLCEEKARLKAREERAKLLGCGVPVNALIQTPLVQCYRFSKRVLTLDDMCEIDCLKKGHLPYDWKHRTARHGVAMQDIQFQGYID